MGCGMTCSLRLSTISNLSTTSLFHSRLDTIMNLLPGRAKAASAEPNDEAIRRTHDYLRCVPLQRGCSALMQLCACAQPA